MNKAATLKMLFSEVHISVSSLGTYLRCPRQYRFRYIDHFQPETKASSLAFGVSIHRALERYYQALRNIDPEPTAEELADVFRDEWMNQLMTGPTVLFGEKEDAASLTDLGAKMLAVFKAKAPLPAAVLEVECPFSIEIVDPATGEVLPRLVGLLDAVVRERDGSVSVLEHKTGLKRWTGSRLAYDHQITAYGMAAREIGFPDAAVTVQLLTKSRNPDLEIYTPPRTDADRREFVETAVAVLRAIRAEAFWPNREGWQCSAGCEFASVCVAG